MRCVQYFYFIIRYQKRCLLRYIMNIGYTRLCNFSQFIFLPFADFAAYFPDPKIKEVMVSIYQMVEEGSRSRYLVQFHRLFGKLSEEKRSDEAKRRLSKLDALSFLPLLGAMMSLLMLALAVGQIIGGIIGGV